jgi:hypothetical protein
MHPLRCSAPKLKIQHWHTAHAATLWLIWHFSKSIIFDKVTAEFAEMSYKPNDCTIYLYSIGYRAFYFSFHRASSNDSFAACLSFFDGYLPVA